MSTELLIIIGVVFAFSLYYDLKYKGIPIIIPLLGGIAGMSANLLLGRYELMDGVFVIALFITMFFITLTIMGIIKSGDAFLLMVIMWTTPFAGFVIPAVVCLVGSLLVGFIYCVGFCFKKNIQARRMGLKPYSDVTYKNISTRIIGRYMTYMNTSKEKVNAVSGVIEKEGVLYLDPKVGRKQKHMTNDRYLIPIIPMTPFIIGVYAVIIFLVFV